MAGKFYKIWGASDISAPPHTFAEAESKNVTSSRQRSER
jgi:hypothetical protein